MISFQPYSHTPNRLEDYLPWAMLVAPGVVLNKDGSFQTTARFRGPKGNLSFSRKEPLPLALIGRVASALSAQYATSST